MAENYEEELRKIRALLIVTSLQARRDQKAIELIQAYGGPLKWYPLAELMIEEEVWRYAVDLQGI